MKWFLLISPSSLRKQFAVWMAAGLLVFTVFGFLLLPPIVRVIVVKQLSKQLDRPVTIQKVRLNPYKLSASIRGLVVKDKDGAPLLSWDEVYVNFQLASLFTHAWVFKEVSLSQPFVRVQINKDRTLNVSDIVARLSLSFPSNPAETGSRRPWRITRLHLSGGKVDFTDLTTRIPFRRTIGPLEMTLNSFQTDSRHTNAIAVSGISDGGERFSWRGLFYLAPLWSEGEVSLDGFALTTYAPLYQDLFRFEIRDGVVNLHSTYRYERSAATNVLAVTNTLFVLKSLEMVEKDTGQAVVTVAELSAIGASVDAMARQAEADTLTLTGGRFVLRRNKDTSVNAIELLKPADKAPPAPGGILILLRAMTNLVALLINTTNLANGTIRELKLTNCTLHLEDLVSSQPVRLDLEGIAVNAKNISNRRGTNLTAAASLRWGTNGTARASLKVGLSPPGGEVELALDRLSLLPLAPYLDPYLDVFVLGSKLGLVGTIRLRSNGDELPEVRFRGDAWLNEFSLAEGPAVEGLLRWNTLRLSGIEANLNPPVISVAKVTLGDVFARLVVETNGMINLMSALRQGGTKAITTPQGTNAAATLRTKVSLASLVLTNAHVQFIDRSLHPNVNITLEQLNGSLSGLSSDDLQRADLHLQGIIDKTARAEIIGKINPWNSKQPLDLTLSLKEMELLPGDPYSVKYLGYRLTNGKLSAQLSYQVANRELRSNNRFTLDQLTLGEKVQSPDATTLPVRLAIAILKDRDGRIMLDVPVSGNLDEPQFNFGAMVYRGIETAVVKTVTSPFATLSALFGGKGDELSFQEFQPGSTNLLPSVIAKLDVLAKGLHRSPELQLEIEGSTDPVTDLEALRREKLNQQLPLQDWRVAANLVLAGTNSNPTAAANPLARSSRKSFTSEKGASALRNPVADPSIISAKSAHASANVATNSPRAFADDKGATALMRIFAPAVATGDAEMEREALKSIEIAPDALLTLASQRARNVRAYLLQTGNIEPKRITESARGAGSKGSRVYVWLQ